jgi:hypothetical protein
MCPLILAQVRSRCGNPETASENIPAELHALYPQIVNVLLPDAPDWNAGTGWSSPRTVMSRTGSVNRLRHLPVMNQGRLVGLVSIGDPVKDVISGQKFIIDPLEHYITG